MGVGDRLLWEDIDGFVRGPVAEPLTVPTDRTARRRLGIAWTQPTESNTSIWPGLVNRPGLDLYAGPCAKPAGTHHRSDGLVPSTLRGVRTCGGRVRGWCDKRRTSAILPCGVLELGARIRGHRLVTSHIRAFDTFLSSMKHHQVLCLVCMLSMSCLHVVSGLSR